jgi:hypothetical protein
VEKCGTAGQATDDNIIWGMRFAYWITKATDTYSEYVILIAFLRQQWLSRRASFLRYSTLAVLFQYCFTKSTLITKLEYFKVKTDGV